MAKILKFKGTPRSRVSRRGLVISYDLPGGAQTEVGTNYMLYPSSEYKLLVFPRYEPILDREGNLLFNKVYLAIADDTTIRNMSSLIEDVEPKIRNMDIDGEMMTVCMKLRPGADPGISFDYNDLIGKTIRGFYLTFVEFGRDEFYPFELVPNE